MKKVTIEITPAGWTTTLHLDEKTYTEKHKAWGTGSKSVEGDLEAVQEIDDTLYSALTGFAQFETMQALQQLEY